MIPRLLWGALACLPFAISAAADQAREAAILSHCAPIGDAKVAAVRELNLLKRRTALPTAIDTRVTLAALLAPGDDTHRWDETQGAQIEGYVADVKVGGIESVNCHTRDPLYRDTHIEIASNATTRDEADYLIVEVTPQMRERVGLAGRTPDGLEMPTRDWRTATLRRTLTGHWVRITGWLFFDREHANASRNTAKKKDAHIWRATAWEIHPVTAIEVLPGKSRALP